MASSPNKGLLESTASLLISEKYSDLTITTEARSFKVHRAIICTQSKVLAAMSDSGFRETSTSTLSLEHDDPAAVERMITFLYTGNYDLENADAPVKDAERSTGATLMANALVYSIADKYDIERLKALAKRRFRNVDCYAAWHCEDFPKVVATVFDTTPDTDRELRDTVIHICARHIDEALACETWNEFFEDNCTIALSIFKVARQQSKAEARVLAVALADANGIQWATSERLRIFPCASSDPR